MRNLDRLGMALAHAISQREAARAAKAKRQEQYWKMQVKFIRAQFQLALKERDGKDIHPEQRPLLFDDLADRMKPRR